MDRKGISKASGLAVVLLLVAVVVGVALYSNQTNNVWYDEDGEREDDTPVIVEPTGNCVITYSPNGAPGSSFNNTYEKGDQIRIAVCPYNNSGYMFKHWNTRSDGTGTAYKANSITTVQSSMYLYAIWVSPI